jgi:hypothetical protein
MTAMLFDQTAPIEPSEGSSGADKTADARRATRFVTLAYVGATFAVLGLSAVAVCLSFLSVARALSPFHA